MYHTNFMQWAWLDYLTNDIVSHCFSLLLLLMKRLLFFEASIVDPSEGLEL